jgi:hypothetical protein
MAVLPGVPIVLYGRVLKGCLACPLCIAGVPPVVCIGLLLCPLSCCLFCLSVRREGLDSVPTVSMARLPVVPLSLLKCFLVYPLYVWWCCLLCPLSIRLPAVPSVFTEVCCAPCYVWQNCLACPLSVRQVFNVESVSCNLAFRAAGRERELPLYLAQLSCIFFSFLSIFPFSSYCVIRSLSFTCPIVCIFSVLIFLFSVTETGLGHLNIYFSDPDRTNTEFFHTWHLYLFLKLIPRHAGTN